jgi:hypothetical protein
MFSPVPPSFTALGFTMFFYSIILSQRIVPEKGKSRLIFARFDRRSWPT